MDAIAQIISNVILDGLVDLILATFLIVLSYIKFGNKLVFKIIVVIVAFVVFSAETTVFITSVQILAPEQYLTALVIILPVASIVLFGVSFFFLKQIIFPLNRITHEAQELVDGNLQVKIEKTERADEIGSLTNSLSALFDMLNVQSMITNLSESVQSLNELANNMASSSEEINASTEEISSTIQEINNGAVKQNNLITNVLQSGTTLQNNFQHNSVSLRQTSKLIEGINNKINLLALNASIEAARAGEYGRGFAIVAENIRRLADESKESLDQANTIITDLERNLNTNISSIIREIQSISEVSEETTAGTEEMSASVEEFSASIQELSVKSIELAQISENLSTITSRFKK